MKLPLTPSRAKYLLENGNDGYFPFSKRPTTIRELMTDQEAYDCHQFWIYNTDGPASFNDVVRECARAE